MINLKTVVPKGVSVFVFADLREVKKCFHSPPVLRMSMLCDCWEFPILDTLTREEYWPVSPSKLPRIANLKTMEKNGVSVFIFADLREVKNTYLLLLCLY